jgi:hypothetical protein
MAETRDWQRNKAMWIRVLEQQTGEGLAAWNQRMRKRTFGSERALRSWLSEQQVTGYARQLLVMEHFGYPDFIAATAEELITQQYADRPQLRPIYDAIVDAAMACGEVVIQARKTYVALVAPKRTFARVVPTTKTRIALGLRLDGQKPQGRLVPSRIHATMRIQIDLATAADVDREVRGWLRRAYKANAR